MKLSFVQTLLLLSTLFMSAFEAMSAPTSRNLRVARELNVSDKAKSVLKDLAKMISSIVPGMKSDEMVCPSAFEPRDWWYRAAYQNVGGMNLTLEYKNLWDEPQTFEPSEYQVWTKEAGEYDIADPTITFASNDYGKLVVQPGETATLSYSLDLSHIPKDHNVLCVRAYTNMGTTRPDTLEIVNATISCF